jgi:hypothetical protein
VKVLSEQNTPSDLRLACQLVMSDRIAHDKSTSFEIPSLSRPIFWSWPSTPLPRSPQPWSSSLVVWPALLYLLTTIKTLGPGENQSTKGDGHHTSQYGRLIHSIYVPSYQQQTKHPRFKQGTHRNGRSSDCQRLQRRR